MALDEALMESARLGRVTLRLYGWDPPCLSLGRHQRARGCYDEERAAARGVDIVRRPTGGRAVYHDREITYCVTAPGRLWGSLRQSYARINRALYRGLSDLGVSVALAGDSEAELSERNRQRPRISPLAARACFKDPLRGEVTVRDRKLVGSAQWRHDGVLLQHGSLLLHDQQRRVDGLRVTASLPISAHPPMSIGLDEVCHPLPSEESLLEALRRGFEAEFRLTVEAGELTARELEEARRLESRYLSEEWTWRR